MSISATLRELLARTNYCLICISSSLLSFNVDEILLRIEGFRDTLATSGGLFR